MKIIKIFLLSVIILTSCKKNDDVINFTFLQLNDVYEIAPIQGGAFGGMARVETVHKNLLFGLVSLYQLSFTFLANDVEDACPNLFQVSIVVTQTPWWIKVDLSAQAHIFSFVN